jgi:8-oxo-dGTP pyrophosphatase MutT (NUDIX family)
VTPPDGRVDGRADPRLRAVVEAVRALPPVDDREAASRDEVLAGLRDLVAPFDQDADPTHVTGSAVVVGPRGTVLHRHKRLGLWLQPGGHVDGDEWPHEAALREAGEETGLLVRHIAGGPRLIHVDAHDGGRGHRHLDLRYLLEAGTADPAPRAGESPECRWFSWAEATAVADPGLVGALRTARTVM